MDYHKYLLFVEQPKMKLPLVKSALLPFSLHAVVLVFDFFISSMVVSCLIKILFVEQDSNLHELYSVLVSTFTGIIVIIFTELAGLSYLAAYLPDLSYR
jgi:hypothetical protein